MGLCLQQKHDLCINMDDLSLCCFVCGCERCTLIEKSWCAHSAIIRESVCCQFACSLFNSGDVMYSVHLGAVAGWGRPDCGSCAGVCVRLLGR
jgi:hypothetical protein